MQGDGELLACLSQLFGYGDIALGWSGISAEMDMCNDDGVCVELYRPLHNFPRIDRCMVNGAFLLNILGDEDVTPVEIKHPELLIFCMSRGGPAII